MSNLCKIYGVGSVPQTGYSQSVDRRALVLGRNNEEKANV